MTVAHSTPFRFRQHESSKPLSSAWRMLSTCLVPHQGTLRIAAAVLAVFALGVQFLLIAGAASGLVMATFHFLCYFTFWSNAIAAAALLVPSLAPRCSAAGVFGKPAVRLLIASNLLVVGLVYHVALSSAVEPTWGALSDVLLHYVMPALFILDWLIFVPRAHVSWRAAAAAVMFPLVYGVWAFSYGAIAHWYPYPFLQAGHLDVLDVVANVSVLLATFVAIATVLIAVNRAMMCPAPWMQKLGSWMQSPERHRIGT